MAEQKGALSNIHEFLRNRLTILTSFILFKVATCVYSAYSPQESMKITLVRCVALGIFVLLAVLAYRNIKVGTWLMAFILLFTGVGGFLMGAFLISFSQYLMTSFFILVGLYFTYGGVLLIFPEWRFSKLRRASIS